MKLSKARIQRAYELLDNEGLLLGLKKYQILQELHTYGIDVNTESCDFDADTLRSVLSLILVNISRKNGRV